MGILPPVCPPGESMRSHHATEVGRRVLALSSFASLDMVLFIAMARAVAPPAKPPGERVGDKHELGCRRASHFNSSLRVS
jgi:hypothetical protein